MICIVDVEKQFSCTNRLKPGTLLRLLVPPPAGYSGSDLFRVEPMSLITSREIVQGLRPNVSREEAIRIFRSRGPEGWVRRAISGPLRSIADVYIPFRLFRTTVVNAGREVERVYAIEAVEGSLELFEFPQPPAGDALMQITGSNVLPATLERGRDHQILLDKVRRVVFGQGFFRLRGMELRAEPIGTELYMPYWAGFSGWGDRAHVAVLDAVRRRLEGGKVRHLVRTWLMEQGGSLSSYPDI